jgi:hypothetical protein
VNTATPTAQTARLCDVPGCEAPKDTEDCCKEHSSDKRRVGVLPNDGIIDWIAIDIAVEGCRLPDMTWVEQDIALARMINSGLPTKEACRRLDFDVKRARQRERIHVIQEALR